MEKIRKIPGRLWRRVLRYRAGQGPYRHLIRDWEGINDLELAVRVLSTDFFKRELQPVPLPIMDIKSVLVIAPHQDDEAIGAGGALLLASRAGSKIDILFFTDGVQLNVPYGAKESQELRRCEATEVCRRLGAEMHELGVHNPRPVLTIEMLDRLSDLVWQLRPQVLMLPWLLDFPEKHRLVNHALWLAHHRRSLPELEVWGYQVHNALYPNGYVDVTSVIQEKRELIECYQSQIGYYQCYDHLALGLAAWNSRFLPSPMGQVERRYAEVFFTLPVDEYLRILENFYFKDIERTYRGNYEILADVVAIHNKVVGDRFRVSVTSSA